MMGVNGMYEPFKARDCDKAAARFGKCPMTMAIPLVSPRALDDTWHRARRQRVTASEMAAVVGESPFASRFSLWWAKKLGWSLDDSQPMRIGRELEPVVGKLFAEDHPDVGLYRPGARLWGDPEAPDVMACTPDYLAVCDGVLEPVECKTDEGGGGWGAPGTADVPLHHKIQVAVQCGVFGAPRGRLVRLAGKKLSVYVIPFDPGWYQVLRWEARDFLTSIRNGDEPPVDGHQATTQALAKKSSVVDEDVEVSVGALAADEYRAAFKAHKDAAERYRTAQNWLRYQMGRAEYAVDPATGKRIAQRLHYKRRGYQVAPGEVDSLVPRNG